MQHILSLSSTVEPPSANTKIRVRFSALSQERSYHGWLLLLIVRAVLGSDGFSVVRQATTLHHFPEWEKHDLIISDGVPFQSLRFL